MIQMKKNSIFKALDMGMLPVMEHTLVLESEFMLSDNFGQPPIPQDMDKFVATVYPFKIGFTLMIFCTKGNMRVRLNLQEFLLQASQVLVVLPGSIGECLEVSNDCCIMLLAYTGNKYEKEVNNTFAVQFRKYLTKQSVLSLTPEEMEESITIYNAMRRKLEQPDYEFARKALNGYMQVLFCNGYQWMARHAREEARREGNAGGDRRQKQFECFLELVQEYYQQERAIIFYADKMCLTPKYLSQIVYQVSGRHAGEWIQDYVILEAKALLKSKAYTVQQVSEMLNFPNPSFFGKYFKENVGCPPRKYMLE